MERLIYDALPQYHRQLVDKIQKKSGLEVLVISEAEANAMFPFATDSAPGDSASAIATLEHAVIIHPGAINQMTPDDYLHELLHLNRYHVDRVPQIFPKAPQNNQFSAVMENEIEHQFIYEQQFAISAGSKEKFETEIADAWSRYPWPLRAKEGLAFYRAVRYWKTVSYAATTIVESAEAKLAASNDLNDTKEIITALQHLAGNKSAICATLFDYIGVPRNAFFLRKWIALRHRYRDVEI